MENGIEARNLRVMTNKNNLSNNNNKKKDRQDCNNNPRPSSIDTRATSKKEYKYYNSQCTSISNN